MHNENYRNPDGDKLPGNRNKLKPEPEFFQPGFFNNAPGIIKRYQGFPWLNPGLFKHSVHADMPANGTNQKNNPTHNSLFVASGAVLLQAKESGGKNTVSAFPTKAFPPIVELLGIIYIKTVCSGNKYTICTGLKHLA